jgi:alpha-amylase
MKKRLALLLLLAVLAACAKPAAVPVQPVTGMPQGTDGYSWWNDTVFYEIFVRSFYDSNGDGIGDFNGITAKLDYLNDGNPETTTDLGVTGIWLMPINPSPSYHGYDVTDYYAVNPDYGTMEDFQNLLDEAHARGIRVIMDLVLNHTSSKHPWFTSSWDPASPTHDWYIWSDTKPAYNGPWGQKVWYPSHGQYYYATPTRP